MLVVTANEASSMSENEAGLMDKLRQEIDKKFTILQSTTQKHP
jgi:hypothetical protein